MPSREFLPPDLWLWLIRAGVEWVLSVEDWADVRPPVASGGEAAGQGESRGCWGSRGTRCGRRVASDRRSFDYAAAITFYLALAAVCQASYGREVLPVVHLAKKWAQDAWTGLPANRHGPHPPEAATI